MKKIARTTISETFKEYFQKSQTAETDRALLYAVLALAVAVRGLWEDMSSAGGYLESD